MAYDETGNRGPDGIGMYSDRYTAIAAGRQRATEAHARDVAAYEQARNRPTPLSSLIVLGALAVAIVGNSIATALGIGFDNAVWLMIGMLIFFAVAARIVVKRKEARRAALELRVEAQSLGFSTPAAYDQAVIERRTRLSVELYDELVQEMLAINQRTTGRPDVETLSEFEKALEWTAQQRGIDAALRGQDFEVPRPTLRRALSKQLKEARAGLLAKTALAFLVLAVGSVSLLAAAGLIGSAVGVVLASPLWAAWGALGATLALTNSVANLVLSAFDDLVAVVQRTAASGIHAAALKLSGTRAGIQISALPEAFRKWRRETLGDTTEAGPLGRIAGWIGNWLLAGVQKRALRQLEREAQKRGATEISLTSLSSALPILAASALTGPLRRYLALACWLSGAAMFGAFSVTALALFGAALLRR